LQDFLHFFPAILDFFVQQPVKERIYEIRLIYAICRLFFTKLENPLNNIKEVKLVITMIKMGVFPDTHGGIAHVMLIFVAWIITACGIPAKRSRGSGAVFKHGEASE
jgi:hypothetical protein